MDPSKLSPEQQKYFAEAAKRKRPDGLSQFQELHFSSDERLRKLAGDPFADHAALDALPPRLQSGDKVKFLILGAGIGGILAAVRLIQKGFSPEQIRIVEVAGGIGGTWYWNRYPGLHCDCESYIYLPLLEETGYVPTQKYTSGVEIRSYLVSVVKKWGLEDSIIYRTEVKSLKWNDSNNTWTADLITGRGAGGKEKSDLTVDAQFVFFTIGLFPRPQVPKFLKLGDFEGDMFHTARWDYDVTGGSSEEVFPTLDKLKGKRVGLIGTGATAIQVVPEVAKYADELYVFQRTPSQVNARGQKTTDTTEWKETIASKPGWQNYRMENFSGIIEAGSPKDHENLVADVWTNSKTYRALVGGPEFSAITQDKIPAHIGGLLAMDADHSATVRARVSEIVKDPDTAQKLTPWYPTWCKRPTFSDTYLQTFNKENVHLVDTDGKGVESATAKGLVVNGKEYPIDVLILSTGYRSPGKANADPSARAGVEIVGRDGRSLADKWKTQGASTIHGCASNGFPNFFLFGPAQAGVTANFAHPLDALARHVAYIVAEGHDRVGGKNKEGVVIEATKEAEEAWSMKILMGAGFLSGIAICTPGYQSNEGQIGATTPQEMAIFARAAPWPKGLVSYVKELEKWQESGTLDGILVSAA